MATTTPAAGPITIGVIAEAHSVTGASIPQAAQIAADEINSGGGIDGRIVEIMRHDTDGASADSIDAFRRAVNEDNVHAVIASFISEIVLDLQPWASRLRTPLVTPGAASTEISLTVHRDYAKNKYSFHGYLTSAALALSVCDAAKELLVERRRMRSAVIMSEEAAWTEPLDAGYEENLPKIGLDVLDHIRFSADTADFTPVFDRIERIGPDVIITGMTKVGVRPIMQWKARRAPTPMFGMNSQASASAFAADTEGASEGVLYQAVAAPDLAITPKSVPFAEAFKGKFGYYPSYAGYTAYDAVHYIGNAVKRAGSTGADDLVDALEKTDWQGTIGRIRFYGKDDRFTHSIKYGNGLVTGVTLQWQDGKQVCVWPKEVAQAGEKLPSPAEGAAN
jgi:branched-chain amino acid transport system substrate-binding protein